GTTTGVEEFFVQVVEGYQNGTDVLFLDPSFSGISVNSSFDNTEGKLSIFPNGTSEISYADLETIVQNIQFLTTSSNPEIEKIFSLSIGNANYLPSTNNFYEFVVQSGITWQNAKIAAENRTFFGRPGYLATLTSEEEAAFAGEQASSTGWIGGSDEETEGVWKWVTGPEAGTIFWNGDANGSSPNFAFWNSNEPNNSGNNEDYAHITARSVGTLGSWNDLPNEGGNGVFFPQGYIVEYGTPTDPQLSIVTTTSIYIPFVDSINGDDICFSGNATLTAVDNEGDGVIKWYDAEVGGNEVATGNSITLFVSETTSFYAGISIDGCDSSSRTEAIVTVEKPAITGQTGDIICFGEANLSAATNIGTVNWYDLPSGGTLLATGNSFIPQVATTTSFWVEAVTDNGCSSTDNEPRTEVIVEVNSIVPEFDVVNTNVVLCSNFGTAIIETINRQDVEVFEWSKDGELLVGETGDNLEVTVSGTYEVKAISISGCESLIETVTVIDSEIATITNESVIVTDNSENNSVRIIEELIGSGEYEYSLNNIDFQDEPQFENLDAGLYMLYVKDINECGTATYQFSILNFNLFFTPNGDGINDTWQISGFDDSFYTVVTVSIFDRFGKQVFKSEQQNIEWNGIFNGQKLPQDDYWYKVLLTDINGISLQKTGNFSLLLE
ncbi:T9SS type B sorting domain-containing protein, partial [Polaribacter sp.]|nr:T9SS type B sorting domain-containing protein [Polaribacter sp.]